MQEWAHTSNGTTPGVLKLHDDFKVMAAPIHPKAQKLYAFWQERAERGIVIGRDVPSRPIADLLSSISIYEPANDGTDLRVRLAGSSMRRRFGDDITGKLMSELFAPDDFRAHFEDARASLDTGRPTFVDSRLSIGAVEQMHLEVVTLPVLAPDAIGRWLLAGIFYFS